MRVVNLSRRPFVNHRPIRRLAVVLWVLGAILLISNVRLYREYWLGTAENRERLASAESSIEEQLEELEMQDRTLSQIRLTRQNKKALFLNSLITRRTFPWSDLFDRLEEFTPDDVRLVSVFPVVRLAIDSRRLSGTESGENASSRSSDRRVDLPANEVSLRLSGWAKSEKALATFVDTLYREPIFGTPLLESESFETEGSIQSVRFSLQTSFLIDSPEPEVQVAEDKPPADEVSEGDGEGDDEVVEVAMIDEKGAPEDDDPQTADLRVDKAIAPPSARPQRNRKAEEAERQEDEAARLRRESREPKRETEPPKPPSKDRQQYLEALRARAAARGYGTRTPATTAPKITAPEITAPGGGSQGTRPPRGSGPPASDSPRGEEDVPLDIKPPASSTPRVNGSLRPPPWVDHLPPLHLGPGFVWEEEMSA